MKLYVTIPGTYNNAHFKAAYYDENDELDTTEEYGASLVRSGYCRTNKQPVTKGEIQPASLPEPTHEVEMETVSNMGELAGLMEISGVTMTTLNAMVDKGITSYSDIATMQIKDLIAFPGVSRAVAKKILSTVGA